MRTVESDGAHDLDQAVPGLLEAMWRFRWGVALGALCAALFGWVLSSLQPVRYVATTRMLLAEPAESGDPERRLINAVMVINSPRVQARAAELLQGQFSAEEIEAQGLAEAPNTNAHDLLLITGTDETADGAAAIANAVAEAYQLFAIEQQRAAVEQATQQLSSYRTELEATIAQIDEQLANARAAAEQSLSATPFIGPGQRLNAVESLLAADPATERLEQQRSSVIGQLAELETSVQEATMNAALYGSGVTLLRPAQPPTTPAQPRPERDAALAGAAGLAGAAALAWRRADRLRLVTRERDAVALLEAPLLGSLPARGSWSRRPGLTRVPITGDARFIAGSLQFVLAREGSAVVVLTSPQEGQAKTSASLQIAAAACLDHARVLLVDGDLRARELTRLLQADGQQGLTALAVPGAPFPDYAREIAVTGERRLPVLAVGRPSATTVDFFQKINVRGVLARIRERAALTLIDAPPVLDSSDATALAAEADGIVVVVEGGVSQDAVIETQRRLDLTGTRILGFVFIRRAGWTAFANSPHLRRRLGGGPGDRRPWPTAPTGGRREAV
jgi:Mrp family chromosome partitioning ATPase